MSKFQPLLSDDSQRTESYQIANLFYVALFGGSVALTILGIQNCRMLKIAKPAKLLLLIGSLLLIVIKPVIAYLIVERTLPGSSLAFCTYKLLDLVLFLAYYHVLKIPYRLHLVYIAEYRLLSYRGLGVAICLIGLAVDVPVLLAMYS
ncbi:hypothetical protein B5M42_000555 [Paenibacillus athensensis]|uniref:Uncharacterized protein n=1 Tax=Paenibacillus athensensis TaxID=1967502 RepID=A0A4Y8Q899_9BACL|nr:hypothetical protein [Paenibacillus athensensis]MCD1257324.1 hypothetical protein [Paenibacillus athensensis]